MAYVGVDLHRKRSHVVALDPAGQVIMSRRIGNAPAEFWRLFGELEPQPIEVAFEATDGWSWFADLLADAGIAAHVAHPLATKAISAARVKNDAVDAKTLAHLLRTNLLAEAWIAPPAAREARRLVRTRAGLVRMRSRVQSQLHALLADLGVIPELRTLFGPAGRRWLADLRMPASARGRLDAGLRLIDAITVEVGRADADLGACFAGDHRVRRLLPIPGIGLVTAATAVAEAWDIQRFPAPERLCSWAGLTPGERTSDAHTRRGHTRQAGLALAALDAGRGGHHRRPRPRPRPLRPAGRPAPRSQGRPGGAGPAAAHPVLRRPARRGWLPCLPCPLEVVAGGLPRARSVCVMALGCNGRQLD
jgi:transposase